MPPPKTTNPPGSGIYKKFTNVLNKFTDSLESLGEINESSSLVDVDDDERRIEAAALTAGALIAYKAAGTASTVASNMQEGIFKTALLAQLTQSEETNKLKEEITALEERNNSLTELLTSQTQRHETTDIKNDKWSTKYPNTRNLAVASSPLIKFLSRKGGTHTRKRKHTPTPSLDILCSPPPSTRKVLKRKVLKHKGTKKIYIKN